MKRYKPLFESTPNYDLNKKYKEFNKLYFNNELSPIDIKEVQSKAPFIARIVKAHMDINEPRFNPLTEKNKDAVFIHEMIHVWLDQKGISDSKNLHLGEFLIKAKEIEKKSGLNIRGRFHKDSDDLESKYQDSEKIDVYAVIKTYTNKLLKQNLTSIDFYSSLPKAEEIAKGLNTGNHFTHIYKIQTNSPIIEYDKIKHNIDTNRGWVVYPKQFISALLDRIKKYSNYAEKIK